MKKTLAIAGLAAVLMLAGGRAEALTLEPSDATCTSTTNLSLAETYLKLEGCFGVDIPEDEFKKLYKSESGGTEDGSYAPNYNTIYSNTPQDPSSATIDYVSGDKIVCFECYLAVKAGKTTYFYDLSGWNGDDIYLTGWTGPTYGAISNVVIYGVPEPASVLLLTLGLGVLAVMKRRQIA